jgi:hypothetical protein
MDADGRTYLVTPAEKIIVEVNDAPFLIVEMEAHGSGKRQHFIFRTNVDDTICCGLEHPMQFLLQRRSGGLKPYVRVRGSLDGLVTRSLYYDLFAHAVEEKREGGPVLGLWSARAFFAMQANRQVVSKRPMRLLLDKSIPGRFCTQTSWSL